MIAIAKAGAKLAGFFSRAPSWFWIGVAFAVLLLGFQLWHSSRVNAVIAAAEKRGADAAYARVTAKAIALERKAAALAETLRSRNNETNRLIAADADDLRLRGPGKAACPVAAPAAPGGHQPPGGAADAAVAPLPDRERVDLIALPFAGAIAFAEQCDLNRAEVLTWRQFQSELAATHAATTEKE